MIFSIDILKHTGGRLRHRPTRAHSLFSHPTHTRRSNTGTEVKANQDLVAIGLSNAVGSFFNAYPVAGSFGRTAVSSRSGARSTLSGAITACFIFFVRSVRVRSVRIKSFHFFMFRLRDSN